MHREVWLPGQIRCKHITQGSEPFREVQVTQELVLREAMRQAENTAVGQNREDPQISRTPPAKRKNPTKEELMEGLENDLGEEWNEHRRGTAEQICSRNPPLVQGFTDQRLEQIPTSSPTASRRSRQMLLKLTSRGF